MTEDEAKQEAAPEAEKPAAEPPSEPPAEEKPEPAEPGDGEPIAEKPEEQGYPPVRRALRAISLAALAALILACIVLLLPRLIERPRYAFSEAGLFAAESAAGGLRAAHPAFLIQAQSSEALLLSDGKYRLSLFFEDVSAPLQESLALGYSQEEADAALFAAARQVLAGDELPGASQHLADGSVRFDFGSDEGVPFSCRVEKLALGQKTVLAAVVYPSYDEESALKLFSAVKGSLKTGP
ncbi:MAG: hypothetical protein LBD02_09075 [Christensenellaceae bacterium]|nr:hypothetical protein [Christensenellaceae bacterium]